MSSIVQQRIDQHVLVFLMRQTTELFGNSNRMHGVRSLTSIVAERTVVCLQHKPRRVRNDQ